MASDSEYEEEETLVMVELNGVIDSEIFAQDSFDKFKILSIDSDHPVLQVENFVFSGDYEHTMGTAVFFEEEDKRVKKCDPVFCKKPLRMLKYVYKTNKKLTMKRVFISDKQTQEGVLKVDNPEDGDYFNVGCNINASDVSPSDKSHLNEDGSVSDPLSTEELSIDRTDEDGTINDPASVDDPGNEEVKEGVV